MEDPGINSCSQQVVCSSDSVDVSGQVEIHFLHGYNLAVPTPSSSALNAESWPLAGLPYTGYYLRRVVHAYLLVSRLHTAPRWTHCTAVRRSPLQDYISLNPHLREAWHRIWAHMLQRNLETSHDQYLLPIAPV